MLPQGYAEVVFCCSVQGRAQVEEWLGTIHCTARAIKRAAISP